jgi:hypothetical protein
MRLAPFVTALLGCWMIATLLGCGGYSPAPPLPPTFSVVSDAVFDHWGLCNPRGRDLRHMLAFTCLEDGKPVYTVVRQSVLSGDPSLRERVLVHELGYYAGDRHFD